MHRFLFLLLSTTSYFTTQTTSTPLTHELTSSAIIVATSARTNDALVASPPQSLIIRDNPWSVYLCTGPNWLPPCHYLRGDQGECYNLVDSFLGIIHGFGPDKDQVCRLYDKPDCASNIEDVEEGVKGFEFLDLMWPGNADMQESGWVAKFQSWRCVAPGTVPVP